MFGFAHPVFGPDRVVAMVAVGMWGMFLGNPATRLLPIVFPLVIAGGGVLGILGMPLRAARIVGSWITASAILVLALRLARW